MPRRDPRVRLLHMRDYARKALDMAAGQSRSDLDSDEKLRYALTHLVEVIGEAASQVPSEVQQTHGEIPWPQVISMRHRLIHGYDSVDYSLLWATITESLPGLLDGLNRILGPEE
jgi:uncharacterized protein with HEPN domain